MFTNEDLQLIQRLLINHVNNISKKTPNEIYESIACVEILKKIDLFLNVN